MKSDVKVEGIELDEYIYERLDRISDLTWGISDTVLRHRIQKLLSECFDVMYLFPD